MSRARESLSHGVAGCSCTLRGARKFYYVQAYEPEFYTSLGTKAYVLAGLSAVSYWLPIRRIVNAELYFRYKNLRADTMVPPGIDLDFQARNGQ